MKVVRIACLYTIITALILGILYPLAITGIAQLTMREKANGQLLTRSGETIGSALIGQPFTGPGYFHSRPSAAGTGYDASASSGSNYGPTNRALIDRVAASIKTEWNGGASSCGPRHGFSLRTRSGHYSGSRPVSDCPRCKRTQAESGGPAKPGRTEQTQTRQFGLLGEPRVNVLRLNLAVASMTTSR